MEGGSGVDYFDDTRSRTAHKSLVHVYRLTPIEGGTRVRTEESWEGFLARRFAGSFKKQLRRSLESGLAHLKGAAEAPTR
jgi:hypothetical protein